MTSYFIDYIEDSYDSISSSHGKHVSWVAEVNCEAGPT